MTSSWELLTLAFLALLIFGPEHLPGMARTFGRTVSKLRREANSTLDEIKRATGYEELRETANVGELRELADELKAEADEIRAQADDMSKTADQAVGTASKPAAAQPERGPAPFDPDAT